MVVAPGFPPPAKMDDDAPTEKREKAAAGTGALLQIKFKGKTVDVQLLKADGSGSGSAPFLLSGDTTLGEVRTQLERNFLVEAGKQQLIYKGRKLNGIAFPADLALREVVKSPTELEGGAILMQLLGPQHPTLLALHEVEVALEQGRSGLDQVALIDMCTKLDSLDVDEGTRPRRKALLARIAEMEKQIAG